MCKRGTQGTDQTQMPYASLTQFTVCEWRQVDIVDQRMEKEETARRKDRRVVGETLKYPVPRGHSTCLQITKTDFLLCLMLLTTRVDTPNIREFQ